MKKIIVLFSFFVFSIAYGEQVVKTAPMSLSIRTQVIAVNDTATKLPTTPLPGREYVTLQNVGNATLYLGNSTVTAGTGAGGGLQIVPFASWNGAYDNSVDIYGIVASGTTKVVVEEGK